VTRRWAVGLFLLGLSVPWVTLFATNAAMGAPSVAYEASGCTRWCHDRGCRHDPVLPDGLTSDKGLYGQTIRALTMGESLGTQRGRWLYGGANLLLFVVGWPGLMATLLGVGLWQRVEIGRRRESHG